jgi:hypothetical protein
MASRELQRLEHEQATKKRAIAPEREDEAVLRARADPNDFIEYCFADEQGNGLKQAPHHREWQGLFSLPTVAFLGAAELGKTQQVAYRIVWNLGRDPERRWYIIGAAEAAAKKTLGVVRRAIASNPRVRKVFPHLLPGETWTQTAIVVQRRVLETKDYSVQAFGWDSEGILSTRADGIVLDDINNLKNTRSEEQRKKVIEQADSVVDSRLVKGGQLIALGNAWHPEDYIHTVAKRSAFTFRRYPVLEYVNGDWRSTWPEQFPMERIAQIRARTTSLAFARMRLCQVTSDETQRFDEEWFERAKALGAGLPFAPPYLTEWPTKLGGGPILFYAGVDLASGKRGRKRKSDSSSIFVWGFNPRTFEYLLVDLHTGKWKLPELLRRMRGIARRYDPLFAVEDNGVQELIVDAARMDLALPEDERELPRPQMKVIGLTTGTNKWEPESGVEGMAVDFEQGRIIVPSEEMLVVDGNGSNLRVAEVVGNWLHNLLYFSPLTHTPDDVMAGWIGWTAARKYHRNPFGVKATVIG